MKTFRNLAAALLAAFLGSAAWAAESQLVVIGVTGSVPGVKEGALVSTGQTLTVPAAASVRLLSAGGQVVVLNGPYDGPVKADGGANAAGGQVIGRLAKFLGEREVSTKAVGAIRSVPGQARPPAADAWAVSIDRPGPQCGRLPDLEIRRHRAGYAAGLTVRSAKGESLELPWPAGSKAIALPPQFAVAGATVQIGLAGTSTTLALHLAPADLANPAAVADWMIGVGCTRQAALFLQSLQ
jgi:hypothetical protein